MAALNSKITTITTTTTLSSSSTTAAATGTGILTTQTPITTTTTTTTTTHNNYNNNNYINSNNNNNNKIINNVNNILSVSEFYNGKTIFITGGTGFMGKVLLEKLLRSCYGVQKIYLLIRSKRGQDAHERLKNLLNLPLFGILRKTRPNDLLKVQPIEGDITQPELSIKPYDRQLLERTVNIVFHSAATVKFDEKLKLSVTINMLGTQRLIELCKRMINLDAVIHVSTAYCNCDHNSIDEIIYTPSMINPNQMTSLVDCLDENMLDYLTDKLIGKRPNTYTFTKALTEYWLKENKGDLPLVIVRPSIVLSSLNEPLKGWLDNWNGPTGIIAAAGKGLFRAMLCKPNKIADLIPVDIVINVMIVSAWNIATTKKLHLQNKNYLPIYHCSTGLRNPITWNEFIEISFKYMRKYPFNDISWYPGRTLTSSKIMNTFYQLFFNWFPAYILDGVVWILGGKPIMVKIQNKLQKATKCLEYFTINEWQFNDNNVQQLFKQLNSDNDRLIFNFDIEKINWDNYIENYILGIRQFIFKENFDSLTIARKNVTKLYLIYRLMQIISIMLMWHFLIIKNPIIKKLWINSLKLLFHLIRMMPLA